MNLKYTITLLSLATPLAAETDCLQDNNKRGIESLIYYKWSLYCIKYIWYLNKRGSESLIVKRW
jgi:hypothetical protein